MTARIARARLRLAEEGFSAYARLLEEAAISASTEAGYPPEWYERENTAWVIRRTAIECAEPLARALDVEITTWVSDFRRVRSRREYELRVPPSSRAALTAHTDWVYVDRGSGRPRRIPRSMMHAFVPGGSSTALPRPPLALPPPRGEAASLIRTVGPEEVDALDHVNNARYFDYVAEIARIVVGDARRPVRHDLEYVAEARAGDRLLCRGWVIESNASEIATAVEILLAGNEAVLTRARTVWLAG